MQVDSFQTRAMRVIAHPLRSEIILTLSLSEMRFSKVMEACGLDPGHDTGPFFYHLSSLIDSGIVERQDDVYRLTGFGSRIAELLGAVRREAEYQLRKSGDNGDVDLVSTTGLDVHWARPDEMESGRYGIRIWELGELEEKETWTLRSEELEKYNEWVDSLPSVNSQRMLVVEREGKPAGSLEFRPMIEIRGIMTGEKTRRVTADVGGIAILDAGEQRGEVAKALLAELIREGRANNLQKIKINKISSEDEKIVQVLQELGFERTGTYYEMSKEP